MTLAAKAGLAWFALFAVMFANGVFRVVVLQPPLGEDRARQVASLTGVVLVLAASGVFVRFARAATSTQLLRVGGAWLLATLGVEFLVGRYVSGLSWGALLADYDLWRGRLWPLVLAGVALGPWLCGLLRRRRYRPIPSP